MGLQSSIAVEGVCQELLRFDLKNREEFPNNETMRLKLLLSKIIEIENTANAGWY